MSTLRIAYLCLQATRQGQASHTHVHEIIRGLKDRGATVDLFEPRYVAEDVRPPVWKRLLEFAAVQKRLLRGLRQFDVLYVRDHPACLPAIWGARARRIPVVLEVNGRFDELVLTYPFTRWVLPALRWSFLRRLRGSCHAITVTEDLGSWLRGLAEPNRIHVVTNGANTTLFSPDARRMEGLPQRYAVFFGALASWHGIDTLLTAVSLPEWPRDVSLVIAGSPDGPKAGDVMTATAHNARIVFLGTVPYAQVPGLVAGAVAGLSPHNSGGGRYSGGYSPLKVYEILACGVPAIVSDFPGLADLVRDANAGIVIPPDDPAAVASAVAALARDPERAKALGANGRAAVETAHSWDTRASETLVILESAVGDE